MGSGKSKEQSQAYSVPPPIIRYFKVSSGCGIYCPSVNHCYFITLSAKKAF